MMSLCFESIFHLDFQHSSETTWKAPAVRKDISDHLRGQEKTKDAEVERYFPPRPGAEASGLGGIIPRYNTSIRVYPFRNRCLYIYADLCLHLYLCSCQYIFFLFPATWRIASIWANPSRGRSGSLQFTSNPSGTFHFSLLKSCSKLFISVYLSLPSALQISKFRRGRARKPPAEEELSFSITAFIHAPFLLLCQ